MDGRMLGMGRCGDGKNMLHAVCMNVKLSKSVNYFNDRSTIKTS